MKKEQKQLPLLCLKLLFNGVLNESLCVCECVYTVKQSQFENRPLSTQDASGRGAHNSRFPSDGRLAPLLFSILLLCVCARARLAFVFWKATVLSWPTVVLDGCSSQQLFLPQLTTASDKCVQHHLFLISSNSLQFKCVYMCVCGNNLVVGLLKPFHLPGCWNEDIGLDRVDGDSFGLSERICRRLEWCSLAWSWPSGVCFKLHVS